MINFIIGNIGFIEKKILNSFNQLPADPYEKSKGNFFRFRKYSRIIIDNRIKHKNIFFLQNNFFFQNKSRNRFAGGKKRVFKEISKNILDFFIKIFLNNFNTFFTNKKIEVGYHQIRIKCSSNFVGYPVPEGWHKDGFNYVIIINFDSKNIEGGITRIKDNLIAKDTYSSFLKKGDYILLNDKKFYHYTDPINISNKVKNGYRDTLVITIKINQ